MSGTSRFSTTLRREVGNASGAVKLFNMTSKITDLLAITKLSNVFDTFDSEAAAIASFQ